MLTHFGTLFAMCHNYHYLTPLTFSNKVKFSQFSLTDFRLDAYVSRGTIRFQMFHVEQK